jgi:hypothetical protein
MPLFGFSPKRSDPNSIRFFQQEDPPENPRLGDRWLNITNMTEFILLKTGEDPDTYQWIDLTGDYPGVSALENGDII